MSDSVKTTRAQSTSDDDAMVLSAIKAGVCEFERIRVRLGGDVPWRAVDRALQRLRRGGVIGYSRSRRRWRVL